MCVVHARECVGVRRTCVRVVSACVRVCHEYILSRKASASEFCEKKHDAELKRFTVSFTNTKTKCMTFVVFFFLKNHFW